MARTKSTSSQAEQSDTTGTRAGITEELVGAGIVPLTGAGAVAGFIAAAKKTRIWDREPKVRNIP
jgi:hypothetical protein